MATSSRGRDDEDNNGYVSDDYEYDGSDADLDDTDAGELDDNATDAVGDDDEIEQQQRSPPPVVEFARSRFRPARSMYQFETAAEVATKKKKNKKYRTIDINWFDDCGDPSRHTKFRRSPNTAEFGAVPTCNAWTEEEKSDSQKIWNLFITEEMIAEIVRCTNIEARRVIDKQRQRLPQIPDWQPTDEVEITALFGIWYLRGVRGMEGCSVKEVFSSQPGVGLAEAPLTFSRTRYENLQRFLRCDEKQQNREKSKKLAPIDKIFNLFIEQCKTAYVPGKTITIDESMADFRGRCSFVMYIPSKPCKYGIKIWCANDAATKYLSAAQIYCGKEVDADRAEAGLGERVVMDLTKHLRNAGRTIVTDNYFTSIDLADNLWIEKTTLLGTIKPISRGLPRDFTAEDMGLKESRFIFSGEKTLVRYKTKDKPKKFVHLLSTIHHEPLVQRLPKAVEADEDQEAEDDDEGDDEQEEEDDEDEEGESGDNEQDSNEEDFDWIEGKPAIIMDYNKGKGGVDTFDQMIDRYKSRPISRRWPLRILGWVLDAACLNASVVYSTLNPSATANVKMRKGFRRKFIVELALRLIDRQRARRSVSCGHWFYKSAKTVHDIQAAIAVKCSPRSKRRAPPTPLAEDEFAAKFKTKRSRCSLCPRSSKNVKSSWKCSRCKRPICQEHWHELFCGECAIDFVVDQ